MEQTVPCQSHGADRSGLQARRKIAQGLEDKGGCGDHSGGHKVVRFYPERFDPEEDAAGVRRLAQCRVFGRLKRSAEFVLQRCIQKGL